MAAGLTLENWLSLLPSQHRIIRMMPNTPLLPIGQGVISYAFISQLQGWRTVISFQLLTKAGLLG